MVQELNELAQAKQELTKILSSFEKYFGLLDGLAEVQSQFTNLKQQLNERQSEADNTLNRLKHAEKQIDHYFQKIEDNENRSRWEEFCKELSKVWNKIENVECNFKDNFGSQSNKLKTTEEQITAFLEDKASYEATIVNRLNELEAKRQHDIENLSSWRNQVQREVQSELSQLRTKLEQFEQEQVQLRSQVSQLQSQLELFNQERTLLLSQLRQFRQEDIDQVQEMSDQRFAELEKNNKLRWKEFHKELSDVHAELSNEIKALNLKVEAQLTNRLDELADQQNQTNLQPLEPKSRAITNQPRKESIDCTHAGNPPENPFCIYCGQRLKV
jgi:chromosome segregation ATPase